MNTTTFISAVTVLALCAVTPSCNRTDAQDSNDAAQAPAVTAPAQPDAKRLLARSEERWNYVTNADWIQAYDFLSPERQRIQKLATFLGGKEHHEYGKASKPALIAIEGNQGYLEVSVDWTPHHPELAAAENLPEGPDSMKETLAMVETWEWLDGEWYFHDAGRRNEFFAAHPKLAK